MPVYSIREFATLTNKEPKQIHTAAVRGKLIKNEKTQIDTSIELNRAYLEINQTTKPAKKEKSTSPKKESAPEPEQLSQLSLISIEQKQLSIQKTKRELELKEIELKQKKGELINAEQTINVVSTYSNSLKNELDQQIQTFIQDICARHGIESGRAGEYKLKVATLINKASKNSIELLLKQFNNG